MREIYLDMRDKYLHNILMLTRYLPIGRAAATDIPRIPTKRSRTAPSRRLTPLALAAVTDREGVDPDFDGIERAELARSFGPSSSGPAPGAE